MDPDQTGSTMFVYEASNVNIHFVIIRFKG